MSKTLPKPEELKPNILFRRDSCIKTCLIKSSLPGGQMLWLEPGTREGTQRQSRSVLPICGKIIIKNILKNRSPYRLRAIQRRNVPPTSKREFNPHFSLVV